MTQILRYSDQVDLNIAQQDSCCGCGQAARVVSDRNSIINSKRYRGRHNFKFGNREHKNYAEPSSFVILTWRKVDVSVNEELPLAHGEPEPVDFQSISTKIRVAKSEPDTKSVAILSHRTACEKQLF